jgi:CHASE2 domain-containing sensor protein
LISLGRILKAALVAVVLAGSAYAVAKLNLFGLESASDRLADRVYQRITAADYGRDRKGQSRIRLVYLDDASLEAMKGFGWKRFPPTFDQQWTMLDDLMSVGGAPPSAMFVDFIYRGEGGEGDGFDTFVKGVGDATHASAWADKPACLANPLIKLACIEQVGGVPIILAKPSPADLEMFTDVQRALDRVTVLAPALVGQEAYPTIMRYAFDKTKAERLGVHDFDVSPAMAMYAAYCLRRADGCGVEGFRRLRTRAVAALADKRMAPVFADAPERLSTVFKDPVDVVWGSRPDPAYLALTHAVTGKAAPCRGAGGGWIQRLGEQMAGSRAAGSGARQECPYTESLGYDRLVSGEGLQAGDLKQLLAGKLVMVGGQFHASNDWVESPVHGQVPGVQYHAMALDNLVEDSAEYRRNASMFLDSDLLKALLIAALAFCDVMAVMARNSLLDHAFSRRAEEKLRVHVYGPLYLGLLLTSVGVIALATWTGVALLHRSPINWIGLGFCAIGFLFYATRQTLPADICGSVEHIALVRRIMAAGQRCRTALKFEEDRLVAPRPAPTSASAPRELSPTASVSAKDQPPEVPVHVET